MITITLAILVLLSIALLQYYSHKRPANFPPGPTGLPFLGYLPFLRLELYKEFDSLSKKYGNICGFYLLNFPVVVLSDVKSLKEGFGNDKMIARPQTKIAELLSSTDGSPRGIGFTSGKKWQEQRRFAFKNLREFGLGRSKIEGLIMDEVVELIAGFKKVLNRPVALEDRLKMAVFNSFWYIISGEKYSHDDPRLAGLFKKVSEQLASTRTTGSMLVPWVAKTFPRLSGFGLYMATRDEVLKIIQTSVETHKKTLDMNNPRDFIDAYLREIAITTDPNSSFFQEEGNQQMLAVLLDLFAAGGGATGLSISWTILHLMMHPNVQEKAHIEIDSVVGADRNPSLSDRPRMPYMEALITESLRVTTLAPIGAPHETTETLEFNGYTMPKNTIIIGNLRSIHYDKELWGDPENFRPERFIDNEGQYKGSGGIFSFSVGKRMCPGENMARDKMFLFLAGLLQQFRFEVDINNPPTLEPKPMSLVIEHHPFNVFITDRNAVQAE